jgi:DNA-binding Lrp family transcriptional regulator
MCAINRQTGERMRSYFSECALSLYNLHMADLDDVDRRLIALLRTDGRAPVTTLARQLGLSRATVNSRLERLVESGTVLGFTVRVRDNYGDDDVRAISLIEVEGRSTAEVIKALRGVPEIQTLHTTNGGWDLVAEIRAESLANFDRVLGRIRSVDGVINSESSLLLNSVLR